MSRNKKPHKGYRPRPVVINTLDLALHQAAKLAQEDRAELLAAIHAATKQTHAQGHQVTVVRDIGGLAA